MDYSNIHQNLCSPASTQLHSDEVWWPNWQNSICRLKRRSRVRWLPTREFVSPRNFANNRKPSTPLLHGRRMGGGTTNHTHWSAFLCTSINRMNQAVDSRRSMYQATRVIKIYTKALESGRLLCSLSSRSFDAVLFTSCTAVSLSGPQRSIRPSIPTVNHR